MILSSSASTKLISLAAAVVIASSITACINQSHEDTAATPVLSGAPSTNLPMPPLKARSDIGWVLNDGTRARLADYEGKLLVIDFYATWCQPCRESIPRLIALQQIYGARGIQVVGLNVGGADDRIKVRNFVKELSIQYPLGFPDQALTDLFLSDDQTIPQTFVFGRQGQLVKRFIGYQGATGDELEKVIQKEIAVK
jgi:thiol-disulfide isomerase/thioredoxin